MVPTELLEWFKKFFIDNPLAAYAALSTVACIVLFLRGEKATRQRIEDLRVLIPLATDLAEQNAELQEFAKTIIANAERRRKLRTLSQAPSGSGYSGESPTGNATPKLRSEDERASTEGRSGSGTGEDRSPGLEEELEGSRGQLPKKGR